MIRRDPLMDISYVGTGTEFSILANRLSWFYDLTGPSVSLDTACSSSLMALHLACQSLKAGEADMVSQAVAYLSCALLQYLMYDFRVLSVGRTFF